MTYNSNLTPEKTRSFEGKLTGFKNNNERNFETKHLRAYIKGHRQFQHGYYYEHGVRYPAMFKVQEKWN